MPGPLFKTPSPSRRPQPGEQVSAGMLHQALDRLLRVERWIAGYRDLRQSAAGYDGPFAVTKSPTQSDHVVVGAKRANVDYPWIDRIAVGETLLDNGAAPETLTITVTGYVYYAVTRQTTPAAVLANAASIPQNTDSIVYVPVATVALTDTVASVTEQLLNDEIFVEQTTVCSITAGPQGTAGAGYSATSSTSDTIGV